MAALRFLADNSEVRLTLPAGVDLTGAFTIAALMRRHSSGLSTDQLVFGHHNSAGTAVNVGMSFGFDAINDIPELPCATVNNSPTWDNSQTSMVATDGWYILAISKAAGTTAPRVHWAKIDEGTWVHQSGTVAGNPTSASGGTIRIGEYMDGFDYGGWVGMIAAWNVSMSDGQAEALLTNKSTTDWISHAAGAPKYCVQTITNPAQLTDLMGSGVAYSTHSGTFLDVDEEPPGWTFAPVSLGSTMNSTPNQATYSHVCNAPVPADSTVFVAFNYLGPGGAGTSPPVTINGNAMTQVVEVSPGGNAMRVALYAYYTAAGFGSAPTIVVDPSITDTWACPMHACWVPNDQTANIDDTGGASSSANSGTTWASDSLGLTGDTGITIGYAYGDGIASPGGHTPDANTRELSDIWDSGDEWQSVMVWRLSSLAANIVGGTWNNDSNFGEGWVAAVIPTPDAGPPPVTGGAMGQGGIGQGAIAKHVLTTGTTITNTAIGSAEAFGSTTLQRGAVSITNTGIASAEAWGSTTVQRGAVSITNTGIASAEAWGSHTLTRGAVSITATGIPTAEAFGATTVAGAAANITTTGIASAEAFGSTTVNRGAVSVTVSGIASAEAFGSTTVNRGAVSISPAGIASAEAWGSTALSQTITPPSIGSAEAFGTTQVNRGAVSVSPSSITSAEAWGSPSLTVGAVSITPAGIASAEAFGSTVISTGAGLIAPSGIASAETWGTAQLTTGAVSISATGIASAEAFGTTSVNRGAVSVSPSGIASTEAFGSATVQRGAVSASPAGISSAEAWGTAQVTRGAVSVSPSSIGSAEAFGSAQLQPVTTVSPSSISSAEAWGATTVTLAPAGLQPIGIPSAEAFGNATLQRGAVTIDLGGTGGTSDRPVRGLVAADKDLIRLAVPAYFTEYTLVAVVKRASTNAFQGVFTVGGEGGFGPDLVWEFTPNGMEIVHQRPSGRHAYHNSTVWDTTDWQFIAVSVASGVAHFWQFDGTNWNVVNADKTLGDDPLTVEDWTSAPRPMESRIGNWNSEFNPFNGSVAVVGLWRGTALSSSAVQALAGGTPASWAAAGASHVWPLNQASTATPVEDIVGSLDQIGLDGTDVITSDGVPSSLFNFAGVGDGYGIPSAEAFGSPSIVPAQSVSPTSIPSAESFGTPQVQRGAVQISTTGIGSSEVFGTAVIAAGQIFIAAQPINSAEAWGIPTLLEVIRVYEDLIPVVDERPYRLQVATAPWTVQVGEELNLSVSIDEVEDRIKVSVGVGAGEVHVIEVLGKSVVVSDPGAPDVVITEDPYRLAVALPQFTVAVSEVPGLSVEFDPVDARPVLAVGVGEYTVRVDDRKAIVVTSEPDGNNVSVVEVPGRLVEVVE